MSVLQSMVRELLEKERVVFAGVEFSAVKSGASSVVSSAAHYFDLAREGNGNVSSALDALPGVGDVEGNVQEKLNCVLETVRDCTNRTNLTESRLSENEVRMTEAETVSAEATKSFQEARESLSNASSHLNYTADQLTATKKSLDANIVLNQEVRRNISQLKAKLKALKNLLSAGCDRKLVFSNGSKGASYKLKNVTDSGFEVGSRFTSASFYFRPEEDSGLLLYIGEHKDVPSSTSHFFAVEMVSGYVWLKYNTGGVSAGIQHGKRVGAGEWYHLYASRHYHYGGITLSTVDGVSTTFYGRESFGTGMLSLTTPAAVVGGSDPTAVNMTHLQGNVNETRFIGAMEKLVLNQQTVGVSDLDYAPLNGTANCPVRNVTETQVTSGYFFGDSYLQFQRPQVTNQSIRDISFRFSTDQPSAQLFFMSTDSQDTFLAIGIRESHPLFVFSCGASAGVVQPLDVTLMNAEWHFVNASLSSNGIFCRLTADVDGVELSGFQTSMADFTKLNDRLFIGGLPDSETRIDPVLSFFFLGIQDYRGCIRDVTFNSKNHLVFNSAVDSQNVALDSACPFDRVPGFSFKGEGYGRVISDVDITQLTFSVFTKQESGVLFYAKKETDYLYVAIFNGDVILLGQVSGATYKAGTCGFRLHDGGNHVVEINLKENSSYISVDKNTVGFDGGMPFHSQGDAFYGGIPSDKLPSARDTIKDMPVTDGFVGCIVNSAVNKDSSIDTFEERVNVDLQGCGKLAVTSVPVQSPRCPGSVPDPPTTAVPTTPPPTNPPCVAENVSEILSDARSTLVERDSYFQFAVPSSGFPAARTDLEFEFRTFSSEGILFYVFGQNQRDFFGLELRDGRIRFGFDCGNLPRFLTTNSTYNDGEWHKITINRLRLDATLAVDGVSYVMPPAVASLVGISIEGIMYLGGTPLSFIPRRFLQSGEESRPSVVACFKNIQLNGKTSEYQITSPTASQNVGNCSASASPGAFYDGSGYFSYYSNSSKTSFTRGASWKPGVSFTVKLNFQSTRASGVLLFMSHPTESDYLLLGIFNGVIDFSFDNGGGSEVVVLLDTTRLPVFVCDGEWHSIEVNKNGLEGKIILDGNFTAEYSIPFGNKGVDVYAPILIGGIQDDVSKRGRVADGFTPFRGCIDNIQITSPSGTVVAGYGDVGVRLVGVHSGGCQLQ
eukprot:m.131091 g.131091  ORF g.131091 m.131091 type:complete len:1173 (+) comp38039_c1_seq28:2120-5638(+)